MSKIEMRLMARRKRLAMPMEEQIDLSRRIAGHLAASPITQRASVIMCYVSCRGEVHTHELIKQWLNEGKSVCVPKIEMNSKVMRFVPIRIFEEDLAGAFGILEPVDSALTEVAKDKIDVIIVPGLLFDREGRRLGQGGGYYDRFLASAAPDMAIMAAAWEWQIVDALPDDPWDVKMQYVATEEGVLAVGL